MTVRECSKKSHNAETGTLVFLPAKPSCVDGFSIIAAGLAESVEPPFAIRVARCRGRSVPPRSRNVP